MRKILFVTIALSLCLVMGAKKKDNSNVTVYMYGLSASFNDSIVYLTDVQKVDSAYFIEGKFLGGLREYTGQMNIYFTEKDGERRTNTVFFKRTRKDAEKAYVKLRKRYTNDAIDLRPLPSTEFAFKAMKVPSDFDPETKPEKPKKDKAKGQRPPKPDGKMPPGGMSGGGGMPGGMSGGMPRR